MRGHKGHNLLLMLIKENLNKSTTGMPIHLSIATNRSPRPQRRPLERPPASKDESLSSPQADLRRKRQRSSSPSRSPSPSRRRNRERGRGRQHRRRSPSPSESPESSSSSDHSGRHAAAVTPKRTQAQSASRTCLA